jgi:hypothetical protein
MVGIPHLREAAREKLGALGDRALLLAEFRALHK